MEEETKKLGRKPISSVLLAERRAQEVKFFIKGLTATTIAEQISAMNAVKGWGEVDRHTVHRDIVKVYTGAEELTTDIQNAERDARLEQFDKTIESMLLHIMERDKEAKEDKTMRWAKFERMAALDIVAKWQKAALEVRNMDYSKKNITSLTFADMRNTKNIFARASDELLKDKQQQMTLIRYLQERRKIFTGEITEEEFIQEAEETRLKMEMEEESTRDEDDEDFTAGVRVIA